MNEPILNPLTNKLIQIVADNLPQSTLLCGPSGVGLCTIAKYIASLSNLAPTIILPEKDEAVNLETGIISTDIIRRIYDQVCTKNKDPKVFIIDFAERMTIQAQNSFLKLLEEPNDKVYFMLLSHSEAKLLPTILSRVSKLEIKPITTSQSEELLDKLDITDATMRCQLLFMAEGLPAEINRLIDDKEYFETRSKQIKDARDFLSAPIYKKLVIAQGYKDNRLGALSLLSDALKILHLTISKKPQLSSINRLESIIDAYHGIESNCNIRLCLARVAFSTLV